MRRIKKSSNYGMCKQYPQNPWPQWSAIIRFIENTAWHFCPKVLVPLVSIWWQMPHAQYFVHFILHVHLINILFSVTHVTYLIVSQNTDISMDGTFGLFSLSSCIIYENVFMYVIYLRCRKIKWCFVLVGIVPIMQNNEHFWSVSTVTILCHSLSFLFICLFSLSVGRFVHSNVCLEFNQQMKQIVQSTDTLRWYKLVLSFKTSTSH